MQEQGWIRNPALLIPSFSMVFNQDEKPRDRERVTNKSSAWLPVSSSPRPDRHCWNSPASSSLWNCLGCSCSLPRGVCWTKLHVASQNDTPASGLVGDAACLRVDVKLYKSTQASPAKPSRNKQPVLHRLGASTGDSISISPFLLRSLPSGVWRSLAL